MLGLFDGFGGGLQVRPRIQRLRAHLFHRRDALREVEWPAHVEAVHQGPVVEQVQQLYLGGAQIDLRRLQIGFVLHPLQLQAVQIHLRDVAHLEAVAADGQLLVEVLQVVLGQRQHGLRLQGLYEGVAQAEQQRAYQVGLLRLADGGGFLGALPPQFALVLALVQIADGGHGEQVAAAAVRGASGEGVELIGRQTERGVGPQVGRQLLRLGLLNVELAGQQRGIVLLKTLTNLPPAHGSLGLRRGRSGHQQGHRKDPTQLSYPQHHPPSLHSPPVDRTSAPAAGWTTIADCPGFSCSTL